ncbi:SufD family Fe-S cluster assembly protein [Candidatus Micrarchaeota archaeon]|nr:SufD family Fe-S cluster assembly protein [Candidatus Micrarchaeota archaeon]
MLETLFSKAQFDRFFPKASSKRKRAFSVFESMDLPSPKEEAWRYTDVRKLDVSACAPLGAVALDVKAKNVSVHENVNVDFGKPSDKLEALAHAFGSSMRFDVSAGDQARLDVVVRPERSGGLLDVFSVGKNAVLDVFVQYASKKPVLFAETSRFELGAGAVLNYYSVQRFGDGTLGFASKFFELGSDAEINSVHVDVGGTLSRTKVEHRFVGSRSRAPRHSAVFLGSGNQHFDLTTVAHHVGKGTQSDVKVKGALKGKASAVYRGVIRIDKTASQTDSFLEDRVLHLDHGVVSNSVPSLFIDNNDVRASHAATVSKLSSDALFYLRSRGMEKRQAEKLVVDGFLESLVRQIPDEGVRQRVFESLDATIS